MVYLTYNDQPSGIYTSQVIDVVKYLNAISKNEKTQLIALISLRNFSSNKKIILSLLPGSKVYPMFPKPSLWRYNYFILYIVFLFSSQKKIMARGPFAASLALRLKKNGRINKVIFDARGAYTAELNEYAVVKSDKIKKEISEQERELIFKSDMKLAVSNALVENWKKEFGYNMKEQVIVPCTLSNDMIGEMPSAGEIAGLKKKIGFDAKDIVVVYSGSSAGWQSFKLVEEKLARLMRNNLDVKLLMLTDKNDKQSPFFKEFSSRIICKWVKPAEVKNLLLAADYGILYREQSVTNRVASPVKFAEYLACGLKIIISKQLGDYSEYVIKHNIGVDNFPETISAVPYEEKLRLHNLAMTEFVKEHYRKVYETILNC